MTHLSFPLADTTSGRLRGRTIDGVHTFLGVPYALPFERDRRFAPPEELHTPNAARNTSTWAAAPPQTKSRLETTMGPMPMRHQSEDCLYLNVWVPEHEENTQLPVLVWIHGGGYLFGAAATDWYEGSILAKEQHVIVVTVGFRVGILGYHNDPAQGIANLGMQDQLLALKWIQQNISSFGGDNSNVTLAGQSSGAHSVMAVASTYSRQEQKPFDRIMLFSPPAGMNIPPAGDASELLSKAGLPPTKELKNLPVSQILTIQNQIVATRQQWGTIDWPFQLCIDGRTLISDQQHILRNLGEMPLPTFIMWTADEGATHFAADKSSQQLTSQEIYHRLMAVSHDYAAAFTQEDTSDPQTPAIWSLAKLIGRQMYTDGSRTLVEQREANHLPTVFKLFDIKSKAFDGNLGAGHATDLPYIFGNYSAWKQAPSLIGTSKTEFNARSRKLRELIAGFMTCPVKTMHTIKSGN